MSETTTVRMRTTRGSFRLSCASTGASRNLRDGEQADLSEFCGECRQTAEREHGVKHITAEQRRERLKARLRANAPTPAPGCACGGHVKDVVENGDGTVTVNRAHLDALRADADQVDKIDRAPVPPPKPYSRAAAALRSDEAEVLSQARVVPISDSRPLPYTRALVGARAAEELRADRQPARSKLREYDPRAVPRPYSRALERMRGAA